MSSSAAETPKKSLKGRPLKEPSINDFCRVCRCNFKNYYGVFSRRVSTENLFEVPKREGVVKCRLADLACELGFNCVQAVNISKRVCAKCATKIRNAVELMRFLRTGFSAQEPRETSLQCSPPTVERFKQMSVSPHSTNSGKVTRTASPGKGTLETAEKPKVRRSIAYPAAGSATQARQEICDLMSVVERTEKSKMKVVFPTGDDTFSFRSAPDVTTTNIIRNICNRNWKPVVNAIFSHEELREELLSSLSKNMAREMTEYIRSDSMLKYSSPSELAAFSNRKLVHEAKVFCPLWYACITGAANVHQSDEKLDGSINALALATSALARLRNSRMSAYAKRVSTVLVHSGAKAEDFKRLNRLGICTSHDQVIRAQVEVGTNHDSKVLLWKKAIEERNGALLIIEEILGEELPETIDVSKAALENKIYFSSQAFEKLMSLIDGDTCRKADLENARRALLKEEPVSYRSECKR